MGLFKKHKERKQAQEAERVPLERGLLSICDAWEADVFRSEKEWRDRAPRRAQLAAELTHWMEEEVVRDGGMISSMDLYADGLTTEIGEGVGDADPELADALKASEDEEGLIQRLTRSALEFTQRLTTAQREGGDVNAILQQEEQKAAQKTRQNITAQ